MDELGHATESAVPDIHPVQQYLERAQITLMGKFGIKHVKTKFAVFGSISFCGHKLAPCCGVKGAGNEPSRCQAIHVDTRSRYPRSPGVRSGLLLSSSDWRFPNFCLK